VLRDGGARRDGGTGRSVGVVDVDTVGRRGTAAVAGVARTERRRALLEHRARIAVLHQHVTPRLDL